MNINGVSPRNDSSQLTGSSSAEMGKQEFLKLLVAQLENQNPLNPMDNTEFVAQLAQFSSLEQLMTVNRGLSNLEQSITSAHTGQLAGLIGKSVEVDGSRLQHQQSGPDAIAYAVESAVDKVQLEIRDSSGALVRTLKLGAQPVGAHEVAWDGRSDRGEFVAPGLYQVIATATAKDGTSVPVVQRVARVVSGVVVEDGRAYLEAGSQKLTLDDIAAIR